MRPDLVDARCNLGNLLLETGAIADARAAYEAALARRPALADALVGIGRCEEAEGRAGSAADWFRKALDAAPGHPLASRLLTALSPRN